MTRSIWLTTLLAGLWLAGSGSAQAASVRFNVVDADGKVVANAVLSVLVKGVRTQAAGAAGQPAQMAQMAQIAQMAQKDRQFEPQLLVIQTGTAVRFPNFDTVRHHVYSFSPLQRFELKLSAATPVTPVLFDKAGVAVLGCNIHDRMQAAIVVVDTPHFAVTDAGGAATLALPAGEHRLMVWHAPMADTGAQFERPLSVGAAAEQRLSVALPKSPGPP